MADTKLSALSQQSVPALADYLYSVDSGPTSAKQSMVRIGGLLNKGVCQGRLTLTTAVPVTTADVTGATSVFFTPYNGNLITIYDGTRWQLYEFTEKTLALGTLTSGKPYDVFIYDNAGTLTLEALAWTSDTARATALVLQDGIYCKTGALTRRYLGSFYTTSTTTTEDSEAKRYLYNYNNRRCRRLRISASATHSYTTASWRHWNNSLLSTAYMNGVSEDIARAQLTAYFLGDYIPAIDIDDGTATASTQEFAARIESGITVLNTTVRTRIAPEGRRSFNVVEFGISGTSAISAFLTGEVWQ